MGKANKNTIEITDVTPLSHSALLAPITEMCLEFLDNMMEDGT